MGGAVHVSSIIFDMLALYYFVVDLLVVEFGLCFVLKI
jgi:hypothetical protein